MNTFKKSWKEVLIGSLIILNVVVWISAYETRPSELLHVYFLDVGQGDAIFIDSPTHGRVLLDGGPDRKVLTELGKILPFGDRRIDVVIESHPDKDHIGGLPEVVSQYEVGSFLEPGVESTNSIDDELHVRLKAHHIPDLLTRRGLTIDFGDGAKLIILFPDRDVSSWETNDASIVAKLVYKEESFLLTGDSTKKAEYLLLGLNADILKSSVLKVGHHGSRFSTSLSYAEAVMPEYAVISAGKGNSYGHPHQETIDTLHTIGAQIVGTQDFGTIEFETDGYNLVRK